MSVHTMLSVAWLTLAAAPETPVTLAADSVCAPSAGLEREFARLGLRLREGAPLVLRVTPQKPQSLVLELQRDGQVVLKRLLRGECDESAPAVAVVVERYVRDLQSKVPEFAAVSAAARGGGKGASTSRTSGSAPAPSRLGTHDESATVPPTGLESRAREPAEGQGASRLRVDASVSVAAADGVPPNLRNDLPLSGGDRAAVLRTNVAGRDASAPASADAARSDSSLERTGSPKEGRDASTSALVEAASSGQKSTVRDASAPAAADAARSDLLSGQKSSVRDASTSPSVDAASGDLHERTGRSKDSGRDASTSALVEAARSDLRKNSARDASASDFHGERSSAATALRNEAVLAAQVPHAAGADTASKNSNEGAESGTHAVVAQPAELIQDSGVAQWAFLLGGGALTPTPATASAVLSLEGSVILARHWQLGAKGLFSFGGSTAVTQNGVVRGALLTRDLFILPQAAGCTDSRFIVCAGVRAGMRLMLGEASGALLFQKKGLGTSLGFTAGAHATVLLPISWSRVALEIGGLVTPQPTQVTIEGLSQVTSPTFEGYAVLSLGLGSR